MKKIFYLLIFNLFFVSSLSAQQTQTVRGKILDEISRSPIIGATVLVVIPGNNNNPLGTATDLNGEFKLANVPLGRQTIKISYIGYEDILLANTIVTAGKEVVINISLTEKVSQLNEVVVTYDRTKDKAVTNNEMALLSARPFNIDDTKRYAGSLGDPSRMAANFAGVVSGNDSRNDIVVRGNSPSGMLWQMEGLNIPNPNHFGSLGTTGGPVSILNNNTLDKSDFITSAFPAQYGNGLSGVFDLKMRNGNNEKHEFMGQVGFNGFELGAEGPFSKKSKASYLANYRYSTLGVFQALGISFGTGTSTPFYQDINFKISLPINNKSKFTVFGIGGKSNIAFYGNDVDTTKGNANLYGNENENSIVSFKTGVSGVSYERNISTKTFAKFTLGASAFEQNFHGDSISVITRKPFPSGDAKFTTQKYSAVFSLNHKFDAKNSLVSGFYVDLLNFNLFNKSIYNGVIDKINVDAKDQTLLTQVYSQWKHRFSDKLLFNAGLHSQHYSLNNNVVVEPRAGLKYLINNRQSIAFGYGLHSQIQSIYTSYVLSKTPNGNEYTNKNLGFTKSHHIVLSYENNLGEHLMLKTEAYYQSLFNVAIEQKPSSFSALNSGANYNFDDKPNLVNNGTGYNYGIEVTLERFFSNKYFFLITTSLFNSKYKGSDGIERNTAFNTHYVFNVLAGKEWKVGSNNVLALSLKVSTVGGKYFSPLKSDAYKYRGSDVYDASQAYSQLQNSYFRSDVKISYRKEYKRSTLESGVDLQNITNNKNIFQQAYNRRTQSITNQYQQSFYPVPFIRYTF